MLLLFLSRENPVVLWKDIVVLYWTKNILNKGENIMRRETLMCHETHGVQELASFINKVINRDDIKITKINYGTSDMCLIDYWKIEEVEDGRSIYD